MKKRYAIPLGSLAALLLLLLALHLALPYLVRDYLNGKLADMGDYRGHIADVDLALWRSGALARRVSDRRAEHRQGQRQGAGAVPRRAEHRPVGELAGALG